MREATLAEIMVRYVGHLRCQVSGGVGGVGGDGAVCAEYGGDGGVR